jgi:hypothetical protein
VLQIVRTIKDQLIVSSSYAAVKMAGLFLLSDILHNSASPIKHATNFKYACASSPLPLPSPPPTLPNT